ncbi:MAG: glycosyltransferase family 9 protein [Candidatus Omnitrophica bacterium]|nr:glycosyltransferase family 9 protein [Candidatus Omnitrophota bacterium]
MELDKRQIKKILVINLGGIGDFLLSTPALRALSVAFEQAQIYLLLHNRVKELAQRLKYVRKVYTFNNTEPLFFALPNFINLIKLRMAGIDLAINMRTIVSEKSALKIKTLFDTINPRMKAGRNTAGRGNFFDISITEEEVVQNYTMGYDVQLVEKLGAKVLDRKIDFLIDEKERRKVNNILEEKGIRDKNFLIGIHPGGRPSHRWPWQNFVGLIEKLTEIFNAKFVITGDKQEKELGKLIIRNSKVGVLNLCGQLSIFELGALIERCNLYISNDTGPAHIAAILQTPLVTIFGPGYVSGFNPVNISEKTQIVYKKVACAPCNKFSCSNLECLKIISTSEVLEAVLRLFQHKEK